MTCPLAAHYRYDEHLPSPGVNGKTVFGSVIHGALELYNNTGDYDATVAKFKKDWANPPVEPAWWPRSTSYASLRVKGLEILEATKNHYRFQDRVVFGAEVPFLVPFGDHELTGFVDLVESRRSGTGAELLHVVDFKALPLDANVLTPTGWVKFGSLQVGDQVIAGDGTPTTVTAVWPQGVGPVVRLRLTDGVTVRCSPNHLWTVIHHLEGNKTLPANQLGRLRSGWNHRYFLPTVEPVEFGSADPLPLDPYILGVLIGDGSLTRGPCYTKPEPEMARMVEERLPHGVALHCTDSRLGNYSIVPVGTRHNPVKGTLMQLGLFGLKSGDRFIPEVYLRASVADRRALLAGLMDTDGTSSNRNQFSTTSGRLRDGFVELCRSLGGVPRWTEAAGYYKVDGIRRECSRWFHMSPCVPFNPFWLSRKAEGWHRPKQRQNRAITAIEMDEPAELQCISVAHSSGLFVIDDYIITHNSASKAPTTTELALDIQFTAYVWAVSQKEFWVGAKDNPDFPGIENGEWLWETVGRDMAKRAIWFGLWNGKELDAGPRTDDDFSRLYRLCDEIVRATEYEVFVPKIGPACETCDYVEPCAMEIPVAVRALRDEDDDERWI